MSFSNWTNGTASRPNMGYRPCKWEDRLWSVLEGYRDSIEISLKVTGHASVASAVNSCRKALKRMGRGASFEVRPTDNGIVVLRNY